MKKTDSTNVSATDQSRRRFFVGAGTAIGAAALVSVLPRQARADDLPHLAPTDATAQTLGYVEDATKADKAKFPTYAAGDDCANCNFYQGGSAAWGPCQLFPGKSVAGKGWCSAHAKKA
ncbi:MAG: high-potential iron-sulfur protein [Rudaea sp.]|uniref:high-potential iron-sulfur protein n=1 Tax=unclassified Rudaea TaxID=2627037 RepID=UPI0010F4F0A7|nr:MULTISPECIES: high-potential iron-sulfur protein [unclassified Rudaea]MBN8884184.1 high-potential iron-sulfur protein [Rudaea sp.]MBR0347275.1 high-potential iron-sulfur protein [Rudaea sp.]